MDSRLRRIRRWTWFFIAGLIFSGATALPIPTAFHTVVALLGEDLRAGGLIPQVFATWLQTVREGVRHTEESAPFMFYGTDWLAFGHFVIAAAFVGALNDPVRNRWLYKFGMMAAAAVPVWALVFGQLRGIPMWWRGIDASFGIIGFFPAWLCYRWTGEIEAMARSLPAEDPGRKQGA